MNHQILRSLNLGSQTKFLPSVMFAAIAVCLAACGSGSNGGTTNPIAPAITSQPSTLTVTTGQTATFTVGASGTAPLTYQWFMNSMAAGTNSNTFTIMQTSVSDNGAQIFVTVSNTAGMVSSSTVMLTVNSIQPSTANVLTFHNDVARTGQNLNEIILTPASLNSSNFGKVGFLQTNGLVDAETSYVWTL